MPDGTGRPMTVASRSLSNAEKDYSQLDKEVFALVFGVKRFPQLFVWEASRLITDHRPLTTISILGPKQKMLTLAAAREMGRLLSGYQYDIKYRKSEQHGNAAGLSRLPLGNCVADEVEARRVNLNLLSVLPITSWDLPRMIPYTVKGSALHDAWFATKGGS